MKKMLIADNRVLVANSKKQEKMLDKLHAMLNVPDVSPLPRFKVTYRTKKGLFYRINDGRTAESAAISTGVRPEQIISVEPVSIDTPLTCAIAILEEDFSSTQPDPVEILIDAGSTESEAQHHLDRGSAVWSPEDFVESYVKASDDAEDLLDSFGCDSFDSLLSLCRSGSFSAEDIASVEHDGKIYIITYVL